MTRKGEAQRLGRGLSALLADVNTDEPGGGGEAAAIQVRQLPIEQLHANPDQPRRRFEEADIDELAASIAEKGVLQPLLVRAIEGKSGHFQIVAGERRWRAAQKVPLHQLPVIVREFDDLEVLQVAIIENIQRADLNPVEEARGYKQLMDKFGHTQQAIAEALGKSRSHLANILRLLNLPEPVLDLLDAGALSAGHARALVGHPEAIELARKIVQEGLSVRQAEALARKPATAPEKRALQRPTKDADTRAVEADLSAHLGLQVQVEHKPGGSSGELRIRYKTLEQLDGLCQLLSQ